MWKATKILTFYIFKYIVTRKEWYTDSKQWRLVRKNFNFSLTVEEAISLFGLSRRNFWKLMKEMDTIPFLAMYGSRRLIIRSELELWLQNHTYEKETLKNGAYRKTVQEA